MKNSTWLIVLRWKKIADRFSCGWNRTTPRRWPLSSPRSSEFSWIASRIIIATPLVSDSSSTAWPFAMLSASWIATKTTFPSLMLAWLKTISEVPSSLNCQIVCIYLYMHSNYSILLLTYISIQFWCLNSQYWNKRNYCLGYLFCSLELLPLHLPGIDWCGARR